MSNLKRTQVSGEQIRDKAIRRDKVNPDTIGTDELIDGSVTSDKIANNAVTVDKIDEALVNRILPIVVGEDRDYQAALQASSQPSAKNPIATMNDVQGNQRFWSTPTTQIPNFNSDSIGAVRLDRVSGVQYFKKSDEEISPIVADHSAATNLESNPEHRHVSAEEKQLLSSLLAAGITPAQAVGALKGNDDRRFVVRHEDFDDVANGSQILFVHPDLNDPDGHRTILVLRHYDLGGLFSAFSDLGHGVWFRRRDHGSGCFNANDHSYFPNSEGMFTIDAGDQDIDRSTVGMLVRGTNSRISSVNRNESGEIVVATEPPLLNPLQPMILTPIEISEGKGAVGHGSVATFVRKGLVGVNGNSPVIISDGEGSYYVFYLDDSGVLKGKRFHSSGEYVSELNLLPSSSSDQWPTTSFTSVKAAMVIRKEELTSILAERFVVLSLVDSDGNAWILTSSHVPRSFGYQGRSSDAVSLSMSELKRVGEPWGSHLPKQHDVFVIGNGQAEATAVILTCDDTVMVWTSVNDADVTLSNSGILNYSSFGNVFKAVACQSSIEIISRSAEGLGRWWRAALRLPTGKWGNAIEESRSGDHEFIPNVSVNNIDIVRTQVRISGTVYDAVVTTWSSPEGLNILTQQIDAIGSTIVSESFAVREDIKIDEIVAVGSVSAHLFSHGDRKAPGLSYRRMLISNALEDYIDSPKRIGEHEILSKTVSSHRVIYQDDDTALITIDTLQTEPLLGYDGLQFNEHDLAILCSGDEGLEIIEAIHPVRLRSIVDPNPSTDLVASLSDQFKTIQSLRVWNSISDSNDELISAVEGAAMNSIYDPSGNEWLIMTGGIEGPERQIDSLARVVLVRNRMSGTPSHPSFVSSAIAMPIVRRAYHGQCVVANANSSAIPSIPGSSCFVFAFGGRRAGGVDKDVVGAFAENVVTRFLLQNMDDATSDMSEVSYSSSATVDLSAAIPTLLKPVVFTCWDGSLWRLVIVRAPRVWVLKESIGENSLFGPTMPDVSDTYEIGPSPSVSIPDRSACAYFQENSGSPGDYVWNPDMQLYRPGQTTVVCVSSSSDEGRVLAMDFDPANETNIEWQEVIIESNRSPRSRTDAVLVWSGVKKGSADTSDRQLFMMYGGLVEGVPSSEVWLLEYWRDSIGTSRAKWVFLTDANHFGLAPEVSSACGARRPTSTTKSGISDHAVFFAGGRLASELEEPGLIMAQLPYQMKASNDAPLDGMGMDMGGNIIPTRAYAVSEPIVLDNVQSLSGPVVIEAFEGANNEVTHQVRVAVGIDGTDDLYSFVYNSGTSEWDWTTAFSIDEMPEHACTLVDFNTGMTDTQLVRNSTSFFTDASRKLYIVLLIPAMDPNDDMRVASMRFLTYPHEHDANDVAKPTWSTVLGTIRAAMVSPKSVLVRNDSGASIEKLRVIVAGFSNDLD